MAGSNAAEILEVTARVLDDITALVGLPIVAIELLERSQAKHVLGLDPKVGSDWPFDRAANL